MKPQFEKYRGKKGEEKHAVNAGVPVTLHDLVEFIASEESDSFSGMVTEGLGRVLEDRQTDPEFTARFLAYLDVQAQKVESARETFLNGQQ